MNMNNPKKILSSVAYSLTLVALSLALIVTPALALTWTAQTSGTTNNLTDIVYDGSQFVAVGYMGTILTSPDGVTWTSRGPSGEPRYFLGVAHGGGTFVAVGSALPAMVYTSPDGVTWTSQTSGTMQDLYGVAYGGGQFAAVSSNGAILTSPDGAAWTERTSGTTRGLFGVAYDGSQFVAVGEAGTILTSPDGAAWTAQTSGTTETLLGIEYDDSQFVAVGLSGTILTSLDGVTWTARTSGTTQNLRSVRYGGSQFVAVGDNGTILTSPDGVTWTADTSGTTSNLYGVGYGGSQFVAVGLSGTILTSSTGPAGPTIANIAPNSGPAVGGTTVVITGTDLTGGTVTFGGAAATCTVDSATQITCATPAHAPGLVDVVVTTPGGTATVGFTYGPYMYYFPFVGNW
jgi:hypothetical protein